MFFFDSLHSGIYDPEHGLINAIKEPVDLTTYGIDWEDLEDEAILQHHFQHNENGEEINLEEVTSYQPSRLSLVEVPAFQAPFDTDEQLQMFNSWIGDIPERLSRDMNVQ
ncbi:hypothetical protein FISHEDRAFT_43834 [Fistulina hepatica ATCC 64428]|uniref:Uncharacterized protein n=1 Tax=Fistulina hepatica ATCC 64428 TaxID=1128425 RepID=A0A0D7ABU6_9AGAR|nr:hypothetical protein FISHEDRAFT_43834 [Fistulina hepatica ATCC 64428]